MQFTIEAKTIAEAIAILTAAAGGAPAKAETAKQHAQLAADHDTHQAWLAMPDSDDKPAAPVQHCHFSADLPDEYFAGLISEVYNPSRARFEKRRGALRNEPLDTWVHAYAATHQIGRAHV